MELLDRLSPFMLRANIIECGRDRLNQVRNKLQFLLVTEDLSDHSLDDVLHGFSCPVYQAMTMADIERYFHYRGTKILGFRRQTLSVQLMKALHGYEIKRTPRVPLHARIALYGDRDIADQQEVCWRLEGAETGQPTDPTVDVVDVCPLLRRPQEAMDVAKASMEDGRHVLLGLSNDFYMSEGEDVLFQLRTLRRLAEKQHVALAICSPYQAMVRDILRIWRKKHPSDVLTTFQGQWNLDGYSDCKSFYVRWQERIPAMAAIVLQLCHNGELERDSIAMRTDDEHAAVDMVCTCPDGTRLKGTWTAEETKGSRSNFSLTLNGERYDVEPCHDGETGTLMLLKTETETIERPDGMRQLMESFLHSRIVTTVPMACRIVEWTRMFLNGKTP